MAACAWSVAAVRKHGSLRLLPLPVPRCLCPAACAPLAPLAVPRCLCGVLPPSTCGHQPSLKQWPHTLTGEGSDPSH